MLMHIVPFLSLGAAEDAPYLSHAPFRNASGTRESHWDADMPAFFQGASTHLLPTPVWMFLLSRMVASNQTDRYKCFGSVWALPLSGARFSSSARSGGVGWFAVAEHQVDILCRFLKLVSDPIPIFRQAVWHDVQRVRLP
jgi:hypothetical protein